MKTASKDFLEMQDAYLQEECVQKGVISLSDISMAKPGIYLWQGDITRLRVDAIVNAANSALLGCFVPCHGCIDNVIHSAAGIQLRLECSRMMEKQQSEEPVGPIIYGEFTKSDCGLLADCYRSCLELSAMHRLKSVAFCCISTGEFHFPNQKAA